MKKEDILIGTAYIALGVFGYFLYQYGKRLKAIADGQQKASNPVEQIAGFGAKIGLDTAREQFGIKL